MTQLVKITLTIALLMVTFAMQAQNRFYDYKDRNPEGKVHILYTAGGSWHDYLSVATVLRRFLEVRHEYHVTYTEDYSVFTRSLDEYDVIIMNGMPASLAEEELSGFLNAVKKGKPVLGFHAATAAFSADTVKREAYSEVIGAVFAGHPPIYTFSVEIKEPDHPVTKNIGSFEIYDEMYFFKQPQEGSTVLIEAEHEGKRTATAWIREYGEGKIFYTSLGHGVGAATNRYFQQLLLNALEWLTEDSSK